MEGNIHPSWVPNLERNWGSDVNLFYLTHGRRRSARKRPYTSSGQSRCHPIISADGLEISLTGACLDSIIVLGGTGCSKKTVVSDMDNLTLQVLAAVEGWENMCFEFFQTTLTDKTSLYTAFLDVLFRGHKNCNEETHTSLQYRYSIWRRHAAQQLGVEHTSTQELWRGPSCNSIELVLYTMIGNYQFFITKIGSLGMIGGGCNAKVGDHVYVLHGGATPFVLRQQDNAGCPQTNRYLLMGPCYLGGYMYGEALQDDRLHFKEITIV
jgi:hypothetical protein